MKHFCLILLLGIFFTAYTQKQGNIWYFGDKAGIDFSTGTPLTIFDGRTGTDFLIGNSNQEGTATIADSDGRLLFYTGGATIWNAKHTPMPNGTGIFGGVSSTQSSIIVPKPGSTSLFYVFTSDEFQSYSPSHIPKGYRYSIVDMCLDNGRGDVVANQKNVLLVDSSTEKLALCEDAQRKGYWIMGHKMFSDMFYSWHLTDTGISAPIISRIGTSHGWDNIHLRWEEGQAQGQAKFNPQGTKLAIALGNRDPATVELFDFNLATGFVSNLCHIVIDSLLFKRAYGLEFSPDGSKLYAGVSGGSGGVRLYQYDLTAGGGNCSAIISSQTRIFQSNISFQIAGMQMAPDNKIYLVCNTPNDLARINSPNLPGAACNFDSSAILLSPARCFYAMPAFIAGYKYHNGIACKTIGPPVTPLDSCRLSIQTKMRPNPFSSTLIVDKSPTVCKVSMNIFNVLGQIVVAGRTINDGRNEIQLSHLSGGIYCYSLISNNEVILSGKIVKQ